MPNEICFDMSSSSSSVYVNTIIFDRKFVKEKNRIRYVTEIRTSPDTGIHSIDLKNSHGLIDYPQHQYASSGTRAWYGNLYSADIYFDIYEGEIVLKIFAKFWDDKSLYNQVVGTSASSSTSLTGNYLNMAQALNGNITLSSACWERFLSASELLIHINRKEQIHALALMLEELARESHVFVPDEVLSHTVCKSGGSTMPALIQCPLLNYLMYPMVRESGSISIAKNCSNFESIWAKYGPCTYKKLVEEAFGKTTPNLLKRLWGFIVSGNENERISFDLLNTREVFIGDPEELPSVDEQFVRNTLEGTKTFHSVKFEKALCVYKAFGFDYLYQFFNHSLETNPTAVYLAGYVAGTLQFDLERDIKELLDFAQYYDKSKVIEFYANTHFSDTIHMIRELMSPDFIPESLKESFGNQYKLPKCKNIKELHDKLSRDITIVKAEKRKRPIPLWPWEEALDGLEFDGMKLIVPRNTLKLAEWGAELKNCIASYDYKAVDKIVLLVGIEKDGKITYAMELAPLVLLSKDIPANLPADISDEEWRSKFGGKLNHNHSQWENRKNMVDKGVFGLGDGAGISQLVEYMNKAPSKEIFDAVSKAIYAWYESVKPIVIEYIEKHNKT